MYKGLGPPCSIPNKWEPKQELTGRGLLYKCICAPCTTRHPHLGDSPDCLSFHSSNLAATTRCSGTLGIMNKYFSRGRLWIRRRGCGIIPASPACHVFFSRRRATISFHFNPSCGTQQQQTMFELNLLKRFAKGMEGNVRSGMEMVLPAWCSARVVGTELAGLRPLAPRGAPRLRRSPWAARHAVSRRGWSGCLRFSPPAEVY